MTQNSQDWKAPKSDPPPVYSSEKALMDYITVKGIQQRTGIEKSELIVFMLKELLDNALDFLVTYGSKRNEDEPIVKVDITDSKIIVSNSNFGRQSFTKDRLNSIFTIDTLTEPRDNPFKFGTSQIMTGESRKFDRTGKTQRKRKLNQDLSEYKEEDIKEALKKGAKLVSYEEK